MNTLNHLIGIAAIVLTVGLVILPIAGKAVSNIAAIQLQLDSIKIKH